MADIFDLRYCQVVLESATTLRNIPRFSMADILLFIGQCNEGHRALDSGLDDSGPLETPIAQGVPSHPLVHGLKDCHVVLESATTLPNIPGLGIANILLLVDEYTKGTRYQTVVQTIVDH
ncbi:hypothetical protein CLAFUW4_14366 [Fulvia fulva]|uniref:Uncharacterized protein n=1 Tax=Passalora fulva TaxID=5499 RepID=A0A9Q8PMT2_PASFU|nr:uncharacterized protein CLAFUR5_14197 [Fulvia fulva]KAK4609662.1 hypothetical protein CLAFUR0_14367 [Fulvia fulva]UJO25353.1 hypothetical protein CLAFUR5_14197 [Fulvia fulva]WPV22409.1 hypothetical protein CLAFUW4_14366 [Fulvia fulva]WPV37501.1 hypothetical protein CLAFUW7_14372 [Fulvia fulva]